MHPDTGIAPGSDFHRFGEQLVHGAVRFVPTVTPHARLILRPHLVEQRPEHGVAIAVVVVIELFLCQKYRRAVMLGELTDDLFAVLLAQLVASDTRPSNPCTMLVFDE